MRSYFFRNNMTDFYIWCKDYVKQSYAYIDYYEKNYDKNWFNGTKEKYYESVIIKKQYEVLKASISSEALSYLEKYLIGHEPREWMRYNHNLNEIFENWKEICFPNGKSRIKKIDAVSIGTTLKLLRIEKGMSVSKVAGLLEISETALRSYENGRAMVKVDVLYGLSQIYKESIDNIVGETITKGVLNNEKQL